MFVFQFQNLLISKSGTGKRGREGEREKGRKGEREKGRKGIRNKRTSY